MAKYLEKNHGIHTDQVAIITGPCHAEEVAAEKLSYLTVAANTLDVAQLVKGYLEGEFIRVWCSDDLIGAEWVGIWRQLFGFVYKLRNKGDEDFFAGHRPIGPRCG
jgi:glycerol-3-phosphate dehydrogenase (NAD(P)+)